MISIRPVRPEDATAAWNIRNAAISAGCAGFYSIEQLQVWTAGELPASFRNMLSEGFYLACLTDNQTEQIVATGKIHRDSGAIEAVFVDPRYMRQGIARQLLSFLEQQAASAGLREVKLDATFNALDFYEHCGYSPVSISQYQSECGLSLHCMHMTKQLD